MKRFQRRYREGYDLPDPVYLKWLRINYPTVETSFDETLVIQEQPSQQHCDEYQFRDTHPGECTENMSLLELISANETSENFCPIVEPVTASSEEDMGSKTTDDRPAHLPSNAATNGTVVEPPDHQGKLNYISKYKPVSSAVCSFKNWMTFALLLNRVGLNLQVACKRLFVMCDTLLVCVCVTIVKKRRRKHLILLQNV